MSTGLDYTASELWKGSTRLEWRNAQGTSGSTGIMSTVSVARKLDRNWTALARNYYATTDSATIAGTQMQDRFQVGFAYRPVDADRFDMLGKIEYKLEKNGETSTAENRKAITASISANWHPTRSWWLNGRLAAKTSSEAYASSTGATGLTSKFNAAMISGRAVYDVAFERVSAVNEYDVKAA